MKDVLTMNILRELDDTRATLGVLPHESLLQAAERVARERDELRRKSIGEVPRVEKNELTGDADFDEMLRKCVEILEVKGIDYTIGLGSKDRLHNFRTSAEFVGVDQKITWATYFYKHVSAIFAYVKNDGQHESEPIQERIADCINYLLLFHKMTKEEKSARSVNNDCVSRHGCG